MLVGSMRFFGMAGLRKLVHEARRVSDVFGNRMGVYVHERRWRRPATQGLRGGDVHARCEAHGEMGVSQLVIVQAFVMAFDGRALIRARVASSVFVAMPSGCVAPFDNAIWIS